MLKNCIKNWKRIDDDMAADVAQRERSKIKCYASAFSNILIRNLTGQISNAYNGPQASSYVAFNKNHGIKCGAFSDEIFAN